MGGHGGLLQCCNTEGSAWVPLPLTEQMACELGLEGLKAACGSSGFIRMWDSWKAQVGSKKG